MPELPEVETVMQGLIPSMQGQSIKNVSINRYDLRKTIPQDFPQRVQNASIKNMERRAKYILIHLNNGLSIILHLGMSGRVRIDEAAQDYEARKHDHALFDLSNNARIVYEDPRRFGMLYIEPTNNWHQQMPFSAMGPEPLSPDFNASYLYQALQKRQSPIKTALLDQKLVVGLGNIYVCEALFRSHISPYRLTCDINEKECKALCADIQDVLREAIASGGSTLRDYTKADGGLGYFQHHFRVYGQEGEACPAHNCHGIIKRTTQAGRSSFYCPICQN